MKSQQSQVLADMLKSHYDMHGLLLEVTGNESGNINLQDLIVGVLKKYHQKQGLVAASILASNIVAEFAGITDGINICALGKWMWIYHPNDPDINYYNLNPVACRIRVGENFIERGSVVEIYRTEFGWQIQAPGLPNFMGFPDIYFPTFEGAANDADKILRENGIGIPGDKLTLDSRIYNNQIGGFF